MLEIPDSMNGVSLAFAQGVNRKTHVRVVQGLQHSVRTDVAPGFPLHTLWISSASDSREMPSRHAPNKAVDISRINGIKIETGYPRDLEIRAIVDAIQTSFESFEFRRENFGPCLMKKLGRVWKVTGHQDHIHLSVD